MDWNTIKQKINEFIAWLAQKLNITEGQATAILIGLGVFLLLMVLR